VQNYERYKKLGGIINKKDYNSAITRSKISVVTNELQILQAQLIARSAGIRLTNAEGILDQRIALYGILRSDTAPEWVKYHHSQMSDQRLFAEALRMLGDSDSLYKLINTHPHISF